MSRRPERALVAAGALAGLAGIALSAVAAHLTGSGSLDVAARFLLVHAPALVALAAATAAGLAHRGLALAGGAALALGLVLFCGDLALRALAGAPLLPMAAPTGGLLLMAGWIGIAAGALAARP